MKAIKTIVHACAALLFAAGFAAFALLLRSRTTRDDISVSLMISSSRVVIFQASSSLGGSSAIVGDCEGPWGRAKPGDGTPVRVFRAWVSGPVEPDERADIAAQPYWRATMGGVTARTFRWRNDSGNPMIDRTCRVSVPYFTSGVLLLLVPLAFWSIGLRRRRMPTGFHVIRRLKTDMSFQGGAPP